MELKKGALEPMKLTWTIPRTSCTRGLCLGAVSELQTHHLWVIWKRYFMSLAVVKRTSHHRVRQKIWEQFGGRCSSRARKPDHTIRKCVEMYGTTHGIDTKSNKFHASRKDLQQSISDLLSHKIGFSTKQLTPSAGSVSPKRSVLPNLQHNARLLWATFLVSFFQSTRAPVYFYIVNTVPPPRCLRMPAPPPTMMMIFILNLQTSAQNDILCMTVVNLMMPIV